MKRAESLSKIREVSEWDLLVIGGGATGLGAGLEAASRGYRTLLVEQHDFCKATSSRSTKLIHGGVRYLRQGNLGLVREALRERDRLIENARGLVRPLAFVVPLYSWPDLATYGLGLKFYDLLAGRFRLGRSRLLTRRETIEHLPTVRQERLRGGVLYHDAQFDDSRLGVALADTMTAAGGVVVNYMHASSLIKSSGRIAGARVKDILTAEEYEIRARCIINAAGIFTDSVRRMDSPDEPSALSLSQGAHIVLDRRFLPSDAALLIPKTEDGRVLFAIPWQGHVLVGTTDVPVRAASMEPVPLEEEVAFLLRHAASYLTDAPRQSDILSVFAGIRPLVQGTGGTATSALSRGHQIFVSTSGLVSVVGGKWTTYRKMGEDVVDRAALVAGLPRTVSRTRHLKISQSPTGHGFGNEAGGDVSGAGSEVPGVRLHPGLPYRQDDVIRAVREEMACTVEDVLARRTRILFLDARAAIESAPAVAALVAAELGHDSNWQQAQVLDFTAVARNYLPACHR